MRNDNFGETVPPKTDARFSRILSYVIPFLVFVVAIAGTVSSEKLTQSQKFNNSDAADFVSIVERLHVLPNGRVLLNGRKLKLHQLQRILPAVLVHYGLGLFGGALTLRNIEWGFQALQIGLLTLAGSIWCSQCLRLKISWRGMVIGAIALFSGYALTKFFWYYPILTDIPALFLGMVMLYGYMLDKRPFVFGAMVLGSFTWPTLLYQGIIFLIFPRDPKRTFLIHSPLRPRTQLLLALAALVPIFLALQWLLMNIPSNYRFHPFAPLLPYSILVTLGFWAGGVVILFNNASLFRIRDWLQATWWRGAALCLVAVILLSVVQNYVAGPRLEFNRTQALWRNVLISSIMVPGTFYVQHILFYGPIMLLAVIFWKPITTIARQFGRGFVLNLLFGMVFAIGSESRILMAFIPMLALLVAKLAEQLKWRFWAIASISICALILMRSWLTLNGTPNLVVFLNQFPELSPFLQRFNWNSDPNEMFLLGFGPWVGINLYALELPVALGTLLFLYVALRHAPNTEGRAVSENSK